MEYIEFAWTAPKAADVDWKNRSAYLSWGNDSEDLATEKFLNLIATPTDSATITTTTNKIDNVEWAGLEHRGYGVYGRLMVYEWEFIDPNIKNSGIEGQA